MTPEVFTLSLLLMVIACFAAWLIVKVPTNYKLKFLLIPVVLGVALYATKTIPTIMGTPVQSYPANPFAYVGHKVSMNEQGEVTIELWAKEAEEGGEGNSRLYEFPFNQNVLDKLREMQRLAAEGIPVEGRFVDAKSLDGGQFKDIDALELIDLEVMVPDVEQLLPNKDGDVDPSSLLEDRSGVVPQVPPVPGESVEHDGF